MRIRDPHRMGGRNTDRHHPEEADGNAVEATPDQPAAARTSCTLSINCERP